MVAVARTTKTFWVRFASEKAVPLEPPLVRGQFIHVKSLGSSCIANFFSHQNRLSLETDVVLNATSCLTRGAEEEPKHLMATKTTKDSAH